MSISYPRRLFVWFTRAKPAFGAFVGLAISWILGFLCTANLEDQIRVAGFILQMLGLYVVARGLSETRKLFARPSIFSLFASWFRSFPRPRKPQRIALGGVINGGARVSGGLRIRQGVDPGAPIEQRLAALEQRIVDLQQDFNDAKRGITERLGQVDQRIGSERQERIQEQARLRKQLEDFSAGGLVLESVGLFWLLLATIFSSIPKEAASAIMWLSNLHF